MRGRPGRCRRGRIAAGATSALFVLAVAGPALGNGRFPASNQIVFSPVRRELVVARTTFGILPSSDGGASWRYLCEDARWDSRRPPRRIPSSP